MNPQLTRAGNFGKRHRDQNPQMQLDALATHGYDLIFTEKMSGRTGERPAWQRCLAELRAGDTFMCWKSDRFGRSAAHVLTVITELRGSPAPHTRRA